MDAGQHNRLDQLDELIRHFRPVEQLFRVMAAVGDNADSSELAQRCSEIGLILTAQFRKELERAFRQDTQEG